MFFADYEHFYSINSDISRNDLSPARTDVQTKISKADTTEGDNSFNQFIHSKKAALNLSGLKAKATQAAGIAFTSALDVAKNATEYMKSEDAAEKMNTIKGKAQSAASNAGAMLSGLSERASEVFNNRKIKSEKSLACFVDTSDKSCEEHINSDFTKQSNISDSSDIIILENAIYNPEAESDNENIPYIDNPDLDDFNIPANTYINSSALPPLKKACTYSETKPDNAPIFSQTNHTVSRIKNFFIESVEDDGKNHSKRKKTSHVKLIKALTIIDVIAAAVIVACFGFYFGIKYYQSQSKNDNNSSNTEITARNTKTNNDAETPTKPEESTNKQADEPITEEIKFSETEPFVKKPLENKRFLIIFMVFYSEKNITSYSILRNIQ